MQRSEKIVKNLLEKRGYDVILNDFSKEPGIPDFKCVNFETGEKFYLEVKSPNQQFNLNQIKKIKELLSKNQLVRIATVFENKIDIIKLKSDFSFQKSETIKYEPEKTKKYYIQTCKVCKYRWESRVSNPKACPKCKRYDWKESIRIKTLLLVFLVFFSIFLIQSASAHPPSYSLNSANSTLGGTDIKHSLYWNDTVGLSGYIFSFDNCTGTLVNSTWVSMTGTGNWTNVTKTVSSIAGCTVRWCAYSNDTSNTWNGTSCASPFSYATSSYLTVSKNTTTSKRGGFVNITISSSLQPTANMTKPNGTVVLLTTPVSKGNSMYETNYTFQSTDPSGSYMIGSSTLTNSTVTNITMNSTISVTLESDKMSAARKISTRSGNNIFVYGTAIYSIDGLACSGCTVAFTYDNNLAGSNTTDSLGIYNFIFNAPADGNYSFKVQTTDSFNNTGSNATIMSIKTRPEYVKFRFSYALGTTKINDVYKIGTAGNVSGLVDSSDISILQYSSNLTHDYVCTYDNTEYSGGLSISLIHSYKSSYLDYVNFSVSSSTNYTLELRNKIDGSNLILAYTKGTCDNIENKMYLIEKQSIPSSSFSTFSYGGPVQYPYEIRAEYDRIDINGTGRWASGSNKICIQKTGVSSANKPIVDVEAC